MCLIVHKPIGRPFDVDVVRRAAWTNSDGIGLVWIDPVDGSIRHRKVLPRTVSESVDSAAAIAETTSSEVEAALHLRMRTHGQISLDNVHPFVSKCGKAALMHNGILSDYAPKRDWKNQESDTAIFSRLAAFPLLELVRDEETMSEVLAMLNEEVGKANRIIIAREGFGLHRIGHWTEKDGLYYSNSGSLYPVTTVSHGRYWEWTEEPVYRNSKDRRRLSAQSGWTIDEVDAIEPETLTDLTDLTYEQLRSFCRRNPDELAELVYDHLAYYDWTGGETPIDADWTIEE